MGFAAIFKIKKKCSKLYTIFFIFWNVPTVLFTKLIIRLQNLIAILVHVAFDMRLDISLLIFEKKKCFLFSFFLFSFLWATQTHKGKIHGKGKRKTLRKHRPQGTSPRNIGSTPRIWERKYPR